MGAPGSCRQHTGFTIPLLQAFSGAAVALLRLGGELTARLSDCLLGAADWLDPPPVVVAAQLAEVRRGPVEPGPADTLVARHRAFHRSYRP